METWWVLLLVLNLTAWPVRAAGQFGFEQVRDQARALGGQPFHPPAAHVPDSLLKLNYNQFQSIQFKRGHGLWANDRLPFQVEFFVPGFFHKQTVIIHEVSERGIRKIPFSAEDFAFGTTRIDLMANLEYAGFRILLSGPPVEELAAFLDASYFRMVGRGQAFGASARGLALNTVPLGQEEFPAFREFWLRKPEPAERSVTAWALMDSPSVAGAFEFVIFPGLETVTQTKAVFFPRQEVKEFGVAALTSMFLYDQNSHPPNLDFRPAVHDSDGLLLQTGWGDWLWRPLDNAKMMRVNGYQDSNPKGFGLMQRDRDFDHYQDLVARFELRPSVWIEPKGNWGPGRVELVQLPTNLEYTDNVVAFWVPAVPPKAGESLSVSYNIHWLTNQLGAPSLGWVEATRVGHALAQPPEVPECLRFVIDFAGSGLRGLAAAQPLESEVHCGPGAELVNSTLLKNEVNGTWRLVIAITVPAKAVDLDARLTLRKQPITEKWTYTWQP